jgi:O-antigen/teichoic acid export membrane protein
MSLKARVAGGLKWQAVTVIGRQLLSLVIFTILTRLLGPEDFGLMGLTFVYLTIAGTIADQGLGSAIIQRAKLEPAHLHSTFWFTLGCAGLLCGGTLIFAGVLANLFDEPRLAPLLQWTSLSLVFSATVAVQNALFTRELDFRRPAIRNLIGQVAGGALGIGMALTGWGVWSLVGQQLGVALVGAILMTVMSPYRPAWQFSPTHLYELLRVITFGTVCRSRPYTRVAPAEHRSGDFRCFDARAIQTPA